MSALVLISSIAGEDLSLRFANAYPRPLKLHAASSILQFVMGILLFFASLAIPRRPEVFHEGKPVDREHTVSFLSRFTFSWPAPVLDYAIKHGKLTAEDLPIVANDARARSLQYRFDAVGVRDRLWKQLFLSHKAGFLSQWSLQIITAFTNFLPQIFLYTVLRLLEARDAGASNQLQLWLVAVGIGLAVGLGAWLESQLFYVCFLKLGIPLYEQLSAVIFGKAIRKKDVKSAAKVDQDAELRGDFDKKATAKDEAEAEDNDDEEVTKSKQSTINLIGVDSKRVSDFATFNHILLGSVMKLILALFFLVQLVGWIPTLCGIAAPVAVAPLNWAASKKYGETQDNLMKYRDQKMAVVTEALQGIRQIKFSALEQDWYDRILKTRRKELNMQWTSFLMDTVLLSIWGFAPIMMSTISLSVYAYTSGGLEASVAFTTLSIFEAIEMSLSVLPEMITETIDAFISARRIQVYLDSAERHPEMISDGPSISFTNATISWPSDDDDDSDDRKFTLEDLNIDFVMGELNIISGRTGSGKSLLLSAIIGETDVLEGKVTVPRPPPASERFDSQANKGNWITQNSIAYVSQVPWIENATLRDNILFGLPYDEQRYNKVVSASALRKDLDMLQDGDMTDIGANGINLSGGQKWRTSFARALYSRAATLVLDDIFSAVDAHVGRQLYEEALTGELCHGRTRILVTHHVALCLPKTKYIVLLENGHAVKCGSVDELSASGYLSAVIAQDAKWQEQEEQKVADDEAIAIDDGGHSLAKVPTNQSRTSRRASSKTQDPTTRDALLRQMSRVSAVVENDRDSVPKSQPQKFTEDEEREVGAISLTVYKTYIKACRGYFYWICLLLVFAIYIVSELGRSFWMSHWTRQYEEQDAGSLRINVQTPSWHRTIQQRFRTIRNNDQQNDSTLR